MSVVYQHSGKISPIGAYCFLILSILSCVLLAAFYSFAIWWLQKSDAIAVLFNFPVILTFGGLLGLLLGYYGKFGKIRNFTFILRTAFLLALLFIYISWVTTLWLMGKSSGFLLSPLFILESAKELSENGYWMIFDWKPTGKIHFVIWCVEALAILLTTCFSSVYRISHDAYCERSESWADEKLVIDPFDPVEDVHGFRSQVLEGDFSPILELKRSERIRYHYAAVELVGFSKNPDFKLVTIKNIEKNLDPDNTNAPTDEIVIKNVITTPEINKLLTDLWVNQPAAEKRLNRKS